MEHDLIIGELKEFKRASLHEFDLLNQELEDINEKIDKLNEFRWIVTGKQIMMMAILNLGMTALEVYFLK